MPANTFLDLVANVVDDEEEDEEEEDEDEESEDESEDEIGLPFGRNTDDYDDEYGIRRSQPGLRNDVGNDADAALELARSYQAKARQREASTSAHKTSDDGLSLIARLPTPDIYPIIAVKATIGFEMDAVLFSIIESAARADEAKDTGVRSVFCVPTSPGRVYVEAKSSQAAYQLLERCQHLRWTSTFIAKHGELPSILSPKATETKWVRIRGGLYRRDIGQVIERDNNEQKLVVKVVPRIPITITSKSAKRARKDTKRPPRQRVPYEKLVRQSGDSLAVKRLAGKQSYLYKGAHYDEDGFRILTLQRGDVESIVPTLDDVQAFLDAAIESVIREGEQKMADIPADQVHTGTFKYNDDTILRIANIDIDDIEFPSFLRVGDAVKVWRGSRAGSWGRVTRTASNGSIEIQIQNSEHQQTGGEVLSSIEKAKDVTPTFDIGQLVIVKTGVLAGQSGFVICEKDRAIVIAEPQTGEEMTVPSHFVEKAAANTAVQANSALLDPPAPYDSKIKVGDTVLCSIDEKGHEEFEGATGIVLREEMGYYVIQEHYSRKEFKIHTREARKIPRNVEFLLQLASSEESRAKVLGERFKPREATQKEALDKLAIRYADKYVYVWRGHLKGRIGRVLCISGPSARLAVAGTSGGTGIHTLRREDLIGEGLETLYDGSLPRSFRSKKKILELQKLIDRFIADETPGHVRRSDPQVEADAGADPAWNPLSQITGGVVRYNHDSNAPMMWVFHKEVAELRKTYHIPVDLLEIEGLPASGRRTGVIVQTDNPQSLPLDEDKPAEVEIEFTDNKGRRKRTRVSITQVQLMNPSNKCKLVIIAGETTGTVVDHVKTIGDNVRVRPIGGGKAYMLPKSSVSQLRRVESFV